MIRAQFHVQSFMFRRLLSFVFIVIFDLRGYVYCLHALSVRYLIWSGDWYLLTNPTSASSNIEPFTRVKSCLTSSFDSRFTVVRTWSDSRITSNQTDMQEILKARSSAVSVAVITAKLRFVSLMSKRVVHCCCSRQEACYFKILPQRMTFMLTEALPQWYSTGDLLTKILSFSLNWTASVLEYQQWGAFSHHHCCADNPKATFCHY